MNRRQFLRRTAQHAAVLTVATSASAASIPPRRQPRGIIDTHTHFYDPTRPQGVPWPGPNEKALYRQVLPRDFKRLAIPHGVVGTVVVEASPWVEDNQWILDLAADDPFIKGLVGNLEPGVDEFRSRLKRFARNRLFRGIRVGSERLRRGLDQPAFVDDLKRLRDADLALDILGPPAGLRTVCDVAAAAPGLRCVIDHVANVGIQGGTPPLSWREGMREAGQHSSVFCKVSGLVEGTGRRDGNAPEDVNFYRPVLDEVFRAFGPRRVIYGSNWPVCEPFAFYSTVQNIVEEYVQERGAEASELFFSANARTAYKWVQRG